MMDQERYSQDRMDANDKRFNEAQNAINSRRRVDRAVGDNRDSAEPINSSATEPSVGNSIPQCSICRNPSPDGDPCQDCKEGNPVVEAHMIQMKAALSWTHIQIPIILLRRLLNGVNPKHSPRIVGRGFPCAAFPEGIVDDSARAMCCTCQKSTSFVFDFAGLPFCISCCETAASL
jgi:hypothetical protein